MVDLALFIEGLLDLLLGNVLCLIGAVVLGIVLVFVITILFIRKVMKREVWRY